MAKRRVGYNRKVQKLKHPKWQTGKRCLRAHHALAQVGSKMAPPSEVAPFSKRQGWSRFARFAKKMHGISILSTLTRILMVLVGQIK